MNKLSRSHVTLTIYYNIENINLIQNGRRSSVYTVIVLGLWCKTFEIMMFTVYFVPLKVQLTSQRNNR